MVASAIEFVKNVVKFESPHVCDVNVDVFLAFKNFLIWKTLRTRQTHHIWRPLVAVCLPSDPEQIFRTAPNGSPKRSRSVFGGQSVRLRRLRLQFQGWLQAQLSSARKLDTGIGIRKRGHRSQISYRVMKCIRQWHFISRVKIVVSFKAVCEGPSVVPCLNQLAF